MQMKRCGVAAVSVLVALAIRVDNCPAQEPARPRLTPPVCETAPVLDGDLSDAAWQKAVVLRDFYLFMGNGKTSPDVTARVIRDNAWLYVAFEIAQPHPEAIQPTVFNHDGGMSSDDSVEVFLEPGTAGKLYYHYMLNAANARAERRCRDGWDMDITWDTPWRSATRITKTGWQAEIGLPLSVLKDQGDASKATLNLCANRVLVTLNFANVVVENRRECLSWAPVKGGFHEPSSFGQFLGLDAAKIEEPLLVAAQAVKAGSYVSDDKGNFGYELSGSIRSYTGKAGKVKVVAEDKPVTGRGESVSQEIEISKAGETPFALKVPVSAFSGRTAVLSLRDPATDEALQSITLRDMANLSLMRSYARYSYFTSEKDASIACEIGLPAAELKKVALLAKDKAGKKLAEVTEVTARTFLPVPSDKLQLGANAVVVKLRRTSGETLGSEEVSLVKRAPRPGCEWKFDRADKVILNNGKPFFIFGVMADAIRADNEACAKDVADMGFNAVVRWGSAPLESIEDLPNLGKKYGFHVVEFPAYWRYSPPADKAPKPGMTADEGWNWTMENAWLPGAKRLMTHPNVIAWYLADEPQDNREYAARILRFYQRLYEVDGYHPTEVLYSGPVPEGEVFSRNSDIQGQDPYWVPGSGAGELGSPNTVGRQAWLARKRADRDLKLSWITPCAERWSGTYLRIFEEREQRVQTYLALIHGAKALLYFVYPFVHESTHDTFARLGTEMKVIGPACVTPEVDQTIAYAPVAFDPFSNLFPDVQVGLKKNPAGGYILLAANYRPYPVDAKIKVSLLEKGGRVSKLFVQDGTVALGSGAFADSFAAMDTRAYAIEGVSEAAGPVSVSVDLVAHPEKTDTSLVAAAIPAGGVPGRRNILANPGFEKCSIPGMPDYYTDFRTAKTGLGYRLGDKRGDPLVGIETDKPYEGRNCLRTSQGFFLFGSGVRNTAPTRFVFSAYVRGSKGGQVGFYGCADNKQFFPLTPEWQRISTTIQYPFKGEGDIFGFHVRGTNSVWIDAMQFEKGEAPTPYAP